MSSKSAITHTNTHTHTHTHAHTDTHTDGIASYGLSQAGGLVAIVLVPLGVCACLPVLSRTNGQSGPLVWFATFFRIGALILGFFFVAVRFL